MKNKKQADVLISSVFSSTPQVQPEKLVPKKSYLLPFEGDVTKQFMKVASSTYVDLSEPERVWRLEMLDGKPYVVALDHANILRADDYDVHEAAQGVMLYKGDKVIANISLPASADSKAIAIKLKERVASLTHLPPQLLADVLKKEASSLASVLIRLSGERSQKIALVKRPEESGKGQKKVEVAPSKGLQQYLKGPVFELPKDLGSRFEAAISTLKGDQKQIDFIQDILNSYEKLVNTYEAGGDVTYLSEQMNISPIELEDLMAGLPSLDVEETPEVVSPETAAKKRTKKVKSTLDFLFMSRLLKCAAEDPTKEEFRKLAADLLVGLQRINNNLRKVVGYTVLPGESEKLPGASLIKSPRSSPKSKDQLDIPSKRTVSFQEQLAAIMTLHAHPELAEEEGGAQNAWSLLNEKARVALSKYVTRLQEVINEGAKRGLSFSKIREELSENLIPETQDALKVVLRLVSKRPNNTAQANVYRALYKSLEEYAYHTKLLDGITDTMLKTISYAYSSTSSLLIGLPGLSGAEQALLGSPLSFSAPSQTEEKSYTFTQKSLELSQFDLVAQAAQAALKILNASRNGTSEEQKELVSLESSLKAAADIAEAIRKQLFRDLNYQVSPKKVLQNLQSRSTDIQKLYDILSTALPLASHVDPSTLSPTLVRKVLVSVLPALIDPTFYKTQAYLQVIKIAEDMKQEVQQLPSLIESVVSSIEEFYREWQPFVNSAHSFLALAEQATSTEQESWFSSMTHPQLATAVASWHETVKLAAKEGLSLEEALQRDIDAAAAERAMYSTLFNALETGMPRDKIIRALTNLGVKNADRAIMSMPTRLYGKFLTVLLTNLGGMFDPINPQIARPSEGPGSVQMNRPSIQVPREVVTPDENPRKKWILEPSKNLASALGIPPEMVQLLKEQGYVPQLNVTLDMPKAIKRDIREKSPLPGQPGMTPRYSIVPEQELLLETEEFSLSKPSLYIPPMGWQTFSQLYKQLEPALSSLGSSIEEQIVSLYQAVRSPAGHALMKALRSVELAAPLYFYETYKTTAQDVKKVNPQVLADLMTKKGIPGSPARAKAVASMFFFQDPTQAQAVIKEWERSAQELGELRGTPVKMITPQLQERAKSVFSEIENLKALKDELMATGEPHFQTLSSENSPTWDDLKKALRNGNIPAALSMFSGQAQYILREKLDQFLAAPKAKAAPKAAPTPKAEKKPEGVRTQKAPDAAKQKSQAKQEA